MSQFTINRRGFGLGVAAAAGTGAGLSGTGLAAMAAPLSGIGPAPVVAFHMDGLYIDWTGRDTPYHAPKGLRGAEPMSDHISELEERMMMGWA